MLTTPVGSLKQRCECLLLTLQQAQATIAVASTDTTRSELGSTRRQPLARFLACGLRVPTHQCHDAHDTVMSSAEQPQPIEQRTTDPPALWVSLALGSVLIHLVCFILISVVLTRTAKVQLDPEPIAVEFVDPPANPVQARSAAPIQSIAARPGQPMIAAPAQPAPRTTQVPQASFVPKPVVEPIAPPLPVKRPRTRPQTVRSPAPSQPAPAPSPLSSPSTNSSPQFRTPSPQQTFSQATPSPEPTPSQSAPDPNAAQTGSPTPTASPSGDPASQAGGSQAPIESGTKIAQSPGGSSVSVSISPNPHQSYFDPQQQPAKPIELNRTVSIAYSGAITQRRDRRMTIKVPLTIKSNGLVIDVGKASLLSPDVDITQEDLNVIARQIFEPWTFAPAYTRSPDGKAPVKPPQSNLIVEAVIQFL